MSQSDQLVSKAVETQNSTIENSQRAFQQAVEFPLEQTVQFQKSAAKAFMNGLEMGNWAQRQWIDLTDDAFSNYLDVAENAVQGTEEVARQGSQEAGQAAQSAMERSAQQGQEASQIARQQFDMATGRGGQGSQSAQHPRPGTEGPGAGAQATTQVGPSQIPIHQRPPAGTQQGAPIPQQSPPQQSPVTQQPPQTRQPPTQQQPSPPEQQAQRPMGQGSQHPPRPSDQHSAPPAPQAYQQVPGEGQQVPITQYAGQESQGGGTEQPPGPQESERREREETQPPTGSL